MTTTRLQLALDVSDLDSAIDFYGKLFSAQPAKRRPGYANFAIEDPPLKLVLIEGERGGTINHLGVEVDSSETVSEVDARVRGSGLDTVEEAGVECCYALQDKVWLQAPDDVSWEIYAVLEDSDVMTPVAGAGCSGSGCC